MTRRFITLVAAAAMLIAVLAPLSESVALASQKKRTCSCKPALKRKSRIKHTALNPTSAAVDNSTSASLVGPVYATYTLPRNQYFRLRMNKILNSRIAGVGDRLPTRVLAPLYAIVVEVVQAGSVVEGRVRS